MDVALVEGVPAGRRCARGAARGGGANVRRGSAAQLDHDPGRPDVANVDDWTPETAERVRVLRERGLRVCCLADSCSSARGHRSPVTGTAGKTTTCWMPAQLLRSAGQDVQIGHGRAANLWPSAALLQRGPPDPASRPS